MSRAASIIANPFELPTRLRTRFRTRFRTPFRHTIRTRLTLTCTVLMVLFAVALVGTVYLFMRYAPTYDFKNARTTAPATGTSLTPANVAVVNAPAIALQPAGIVIQSTSDLLKTLLITSLCALAVLGCLAAVVGWLVTGRMLRPLHEITAAARRAGSGRLDHRIALPGPQDELRDLSDTFDVMLARLEQAFEAHQRFAANASHELRTPLATTQALLDVAIADPGSQDVGSAAVPHQRMRVRMSGRRTSLMPRSAPRRVCGPLR